MRIARALLAALLFWAVLSIWVEARWAWSVFQIGIFALCGWALVRRAGLAFEWALAPLSFAALWPVGQLAMGWTLGPGRTWDAALDWLAFLCVCWVARQMLAEESVRRRFLSALAACGAVLAAIAVIQQYSAMGRIFWIWPSGYSDFVLGPFVNRNQFAAWIELLLPVALWLALSERRYRLLWGASAAVLFGSVVASGSRAGALLALLELAAVPAAMAVRRTVPRKALVVPVLWFATATMLAAGVMGWQTLRTRISAGRPETLRREALEASIRMARERPWSGSGMGTWAVVYPRYATFDSGLFLNQAHNDWAQWAAEGGIPFLLSMLMFALLLLKPALRSIYGLGALAVLLHAGVDYPFQQRPGLAAWYFAVAGAALAWRECRPQTENGLLPGTGVGTSGRAG